MSSAAATRKLLDNLLSRVQPQSRYQDLCMRLRRITGVFTAAVKAGMIVSSGGVELETLADAQPHVPVPVAAVVPGATRVLADGAELRDAAGVVVAKLHAETVLEAGGRWDTLRKNWADDPPQQFLIVDLQESQIEVATWFAQWLARYKVRLRDPAQRRHVDPELDRVAHLVYGGRRGGKTYLLTLLLWALCVDVPGVGGSETVAFLVSVANTEREEIDRLIREVIPAHWYGYREWPKHQYTLKHGSVITNVSADDPETLKRGRADVILLNEGAKMVQLVLDNSIGAVADRGGIVLVASNPPRRQRGAWIRDIVEQSREAKAKGEPYPIKVTKIDHGANAAIDRAARARVGEAMRLLNPKLAAVDDLGDIVHIGDAIMYSYDRIRHGLQPPPQIGDITREWTRRKTGRAYDFIGGIDWQKNPFIIATFWKLYGDLAAPIIWCCGELVVQGSEDDFMDALEDEGFATQHTPRVEQEVDAHTVLFVGDSSGCWQSADHKGSPSFQTMKKRSYHVVPCNPKTGKTGTAPKNPSLGPSYGLCNWLLERDRLKISPAATVLNAAYKEAVARPTRYGGACADEPHSHPIDTSRYVAWYVCPPTRKAAAPGQQRAARAAEC